VIKYGIKACFKLRRRFYGKKKTTDVRLICATYYPLKAMKQENITFEEVFFVE